MFAQLGKLLLQIEIVREHFALVAAEQWGNPYKLTRGRKWLELFEHENMALSLEL